MSAVFPPCYVAAVTGPSQREPDGDWPGARLGLPHEGAGAVAGWGKRILALIIDWILSSLVVSVLVQRSFWEPPSGVDRWLPLMMFAAEAFVLTATLGGSAGQLVCGVRVVRLTGARLEPWRAFVRAILVCLVIPAVIYNRDQRGLHDMAVDSVALRRS